MENEKLSIRASKLIMQTKLTSLYSSKSLKANGIPDRNMFESDNSSKECACYGGPNISEEAAHQWLEADRARGTTMHWARLPGEASMPQVQEQLS